MATPKLNLANINTSNSGWDNELDTNMQKLDDAIATIDILELGETIAAYEAVYIKSDGLAWLANANGTQMPSIGIMMEAGIAAEEKRIRMAGRIINVAWAWTKIGQYVYLDTTDGALTEDKPADNVHIMGTIRSATELFIHPVIPPVRPLQIGGTFNGPPIANLRFARFPISQLATFPTDLEGSLMYAGITATAATVFSVRKIDALMADTEFGTITFLPNTVLDASPAVDKGSGEVGIFITAHGFSVGQKVILSGTTNYDGTHTVLAGSTTNEIVIEATYVAETFVGTESVLMNWGFFVSASGASFVAGDIFILASPATPDVTLADFGWNIVGTRTE